MVTLVVSTSFEGVVCLFYLRDVARLSPAAIGIVLAFWPLGMAVSAAAVARGRRCLLRGALPVTAIGIGAAIAATSALTAAVLISVAYLIGGVANGAFSVALANTVHEGVPEARLGAVWAVLGSVLNAGLLVGFAFGGFGAAHPRSVMLAAGVACTVAGVATIVARGQRQLARRPSL